MTPALAAALVFTVILLVITAYFFMGSLPLLVLQHDTPMDARFVRGFFNTYYLAVMASASATGLSYAWAGRLGLAAGAAAIALVAAALHRTLIPTMDRLRSRIQISGAVAIAGFRRLHVTAIVINLAQLVGLVWTLVAVSLQMK